MASVVIDGKSYELEKLSSDARAKLESIRFCEQKLQQLEAEIAVVRTARAAYLQVLPALLTDEALVDSSLKGTVKTAVKKKGGVKAGVAKKPITKKTTAKKAPAKKAAPKKAPAKKTAKKA